MIRKKKNQEPLSSRLLIFCALFLYFARKAVPFVLRAVIEDLKSVGGEGGGGGGTGVGGAGGGTAGVGVGWAVGLGGAAGLP